MDGQYPPFSFTDADGALRGYSVDMWRLFEAHTGIHVELMPMEWAAAKQSVLDGRADVVGLMYRTPKRERIYDFSAPFATVPVSIYVDRRIRGVRDVASLRGFPVGVELGNACVEKLQSMGFNDLRVFANYHDVLQAAIHGNLRIFCMDSNTADYLLYRGSAIDQFSKAFVLFTGQLHRAVRKGNAATLAQVSQGMAQITASEKAELQARWLEHPFIMAPYWRTAKWVLAAVGVAIAGMLLWVWMLRRVVARRTRALRNEQEKLRALFDASPDAMWVKDREGVHRECNDQAIDLLQIKREDLLGRSDAELYGEVFAARVAALDQEVMRYQRHRTYVHEVERGDGDLRKIEIVKVPLYASGGAVRGVLSVGRDITQRQQSEERLQLWAHAFQNAGFGVEICDLRTRRIIAVNPTFAREHGYTPEQMAGMPIDLLYAEKRIAEEAERSGGDGRVDHVVVESEHITRDGRRFPVLLDCSIFYDAEDAPLYALIYAQDVTEKRKAETELRLAAIAFESQEAMLVFGADGIVQRVNQACTRLTGFAAEEFIGSPASHFTSRSHEQISAAEIMQAAREHGVWQGERWIRIKDGQSRIVRSTVSAVRDQAGVVTHYVYAAVDLTSEREAHASVDRLTHFDPLTDLPNRNFLYGRLQQALGESRTGALLLFDLDHFKRVNDVHGHAVGDRLLVLLARRLRGHLNQNRLLCRFNGGTFALLTACDGCNAATRCVTAEQSAEQLRQLLHEVFDVDGEPVVVSASIGWTELLRGHGSPEAVLKEAELAMYRAKAEGRDCVRRYQADMHAELLAHEQMIHELRRAIGEDGFDLHMQAQFDRRGAVVGAEALLRWTRIDGKFVSPGVFIPVAEESGLILELGDWVLRRACRQLVDWAQHPLTRVLTLAVNVSARQFAQAGFVEGVRTVLAITGADPARLKLEITESMIMDDLEAAAAKLNELRGIGIHVSLDDFGTGYSSLAYLSRLPLDQLKIDQSFVARLPNDANDRMVALSIIGLGHGLGLEVIAEGVETEPQRKLLMDQGCDAFQGYLLARPMPCAAFEELLGKPVAAAVPAPSVPRKRSARKPSSVQSPQ